MSDLVMIAGTDEEMHAMLNSNDEVGLESEDAGDDEEAEDSVLEMIADTDDEMHAMLNSDDEDE